MGVLPRHLHILSWESTTQPEFIHGDVLVLGQQAIYATLAESRTIMSGYNFIPEDIPDEFDTSNKIPSWNNTRHGNRTNIKTILTMLGATRVTVSDVSPYENPDCLIDLNYPVNPEYNNRFDLVFDIGTLEHVFDIPTALQNLIMVLKPGGRVILALPASNCIDHGFYQFSPTLLYDFFSANGFSDFRCYLLEGNPYNYLRKGKVWRYTGFEREYPLVTSGTVEVFFTAIKKEIVRYQKPTQKLYTELWKNNNQESPFLKNMQKIRDKVWKVVPEPVENLLTKMFVKSKNLNYIGRY